MTDSPLAQLDDRLRAKRESFDRIPVIDISGLIEDLPCVAVIHGHASYHAFS